MNTEAFIDNRWYRVYMRLVGRALDRSRAPGHDRHHITPESFYKERTREGPAGWLAGDPEDPRNLVYLTWREHRLAHLLLARCVVARGLPGMKMTAYWWSNRKDHEGVIHRVSGRTYEMLREAATEALRNARVANWANADYKARQSAAIKEAHARPEVAEKRNAATKEALNRPETKEKMRVSQQKAQNRPEVRAKKSAAVKEVMNDPLMKDKIRELTRAAMNTPEVKARTSAGAKKAQNKPEVKAKNSATAKVVQNKPEVKAKNSATNKANWANPEYRARILSLQAEARRKRKEAVELASELTQNH